MAEGGVLYSRLLPLRARAQCLVALRRLESYLVTPTLPLRVTVPPADPAVDLRPCSMRWGADASAVATLRGVSLRVRRGGFVAVVGAVGSGKSSLLEGLLGELNVAWVAESAPSILHGRVAYVSQQAYVRNATVRDNILFNTEFDAERYARAIHAASLQQDIASFPAGDATEIGERGITVSGGQRMRIALARAVRLRTRGGGGGGARVHAWHVLGMLDSRARAGVLWCGCVLARRPPRRS
jgi:ABC-type bacteriocin/lantibiotic exporter with double-glycine peptidase domain